MVIQFIKKKDVIKSNDNSIINDKYYKYNTSWVNIYSYKQTT